ncbi:MAG: glycosyltransferase family 4 protein [Acidimicrobiales bacterium]
MSDGPGGARTSLGLVVDIQTVQSVRFSERGIPRWTSDFSRALLRAGAPVVGLAMNPTLPVPRTLHPDLAAAPQLCWNTARHVGALADAGPIAYHVMSILEGNRPVQAALPPHALRGDVPLVCTVYDVIPERRKVFEPGSQFARLYELRRNLVRSADLVFTISESTRTDVLELMGLDADRVVNVGTGCSEFFQLPARGERPRQLVAAALPAVTRPFVLGVTGVFGMDLRKNTEGLIAAFAALSPATRRAHQLVVTCQLSDDDRARWLRIGADHGLADGELVLSGFVPDAVLRALYQSAAVFVYPSLYEGFGLPALEAARCGCPTITSNTSAMPEILRFPDATFDPVDGAQFADVLERALVDGAFRTSLRGAGVWASRHHTWERVAHRAVDAYGRLDPPRPRRRRRPPLRIALVGPLPPTATVTATRNQALVERLADRCHLDCVADGASGTAPAARRHRIFPPAAFGTVLSPYGYDAIFYTLASGRDHDRTFELALCYPGIVWFHELALADLHLEFARARFLDDGGREFMTNTVRHQYRERAPEHLLASDDWARPEAYERTGTLMVGELAGKSRGSVVASDRARRALEVDAGPYARLPPTWVVPPAGADDGAASGGGAGRLATVDDLVEAVLQIAGEDRTVRAR